MAADWLGQVGHDSRLVRAIAAESTGSVSAITVIIVSEISPEIFEEVILER